MLGTDTGVYRPIQNQEILGWSDTPPIQLESNTNIAIIIISILLGIAILCLIGVLIWRVFFDTKVFIFKSNPRSNHTKNPVDSDSLPSLHVSSKGQDALYILERLKEGLENSGYKLAGLGYHELIILIDAFVSSENKSYMPNFQRDTTSGSGVDEDLKDFVMTTMLAAKRGSKDGFYRRESFDYVRDNQKIPQIELGVQGRRASLAQRLFQEARVSMSPKLSLRETPNSSFLSPIKYANNSNSAPNRPSKNITADQQINENKDSKEFSVEGGNSMIRSLPHSQSYNRKLTIQPSTVEASHETGLDNLLSPSAINLTEDTFLQEINHKYINFKELLIPEKDLSKLDSEKIRVFLQEHYRVWKIGISNNNRLFHVLRNNKWTSAVTPARKITNIADKVCRLVTGITSLQKMIESFYKPHPYHNAIHAADVLQAFNFLLYETKFVQTYTDVEKFAGYLAAICHDVDHPSRNPAAIMYCDIAVNEYHHASFMFQKTLYSPNNIFSGMSGEIYDELRRIIIRLILGTDMSKHFEYISKFNAKIKTPGFNSLDTQENRLVVMEMALKCSDVSNPARHPLIAIKWTEKFYRQGDREKEMGLTVSNFMDRAHPNPAKCQVGFMDFIVSPIFESWRGFHRDASTNLMRANILKNRKLWSQLSDTPGKFLCIVNGHEGEDDDSALNRNSNRGSLASEGREAIKEEREKSGLNNDLLKQTNITEDSE